LLPGSPWTDIRLRKALNLAIDRDAVVGLMNGLAKPAKGQVDPSSPWFGKPSFDLKYDLAEAKEAGQGSRLLPRKAAEVDLHYRAGAGTGQMLSLPMNEFLQAEFQGNRHRHRLQGGRAGGRCTPIGARARPTK